MAANSTHSSAASQARALVELLAQPGIPALRWSVNDRLGSLGGHLAAVDARDAVAYFADLFGVTPGEPIRILPNGRPEVSVLISAVWRDVQVMIHLCSEAAAYPELARPMASAA